MDSATPGAGNGSCEPELSPDQEDRIRDFLARHGGASSRPARHEIHQGGISGLTEIYAADGYTLCCNWRRSGTLAEMSVDEMPPSAASPQ